MADPETLRFAGFVLDAADRRLRRGDTVVPVQQKPLELLLTLVRARGRLVTRDALFEAVWPGVFVTDSTLSQAVRKVRKALRDAGGPDGIVVTEAGQGYRLGVPLDEGAAAVAPGNLGAALGPVLGRDAERSRVRALLDEARLVTLTGMGGVGKTTLAVAVAREAASSFAGGAWLVEAHAATSRRELRLAVADALGVDLVRAPDPDARLAAGLAARGRVLVVLDNLEQVAEDAAGAVVAWLSGAPDLTVLATSRVRLGVRAERVVELGGLPAASAADLFRQRAGTDDADAVLEGLLAGVDRLPLGVELLAGQRAILPVAAMARIDPSDLPNPHPEAPDRHASLTAAVAGSWALLDADARELLASAALFADTFVAEQVVALAGTSALAPLAVLRRASLVSMGPRGRLRVPVPVRAFAKGALPDRAVALRERFDAALADRAARHTRLPLRALAAMRADLWAALDSGPATAAPCAEALVYLEGVSLDRAAAARLDAALARSIADGAPDVAARAWVLRGKMASDRGEGDTATAHLARAVEVHPQVGARAGALIGATVAARAGRLDDALRASARALELAAADGDALGQARALGHRGATLIRAGRDGDAATTLADALARFEALGVAGSVLPVGLNRVVALGNLGRSAERGALLEMLHARFGGGATSPYYRAHLASEWGRHLAGEDRLAEADQVLADAAATLRQAGLSSWLPDWALAIVRARRGAAIGTLLDHAESGAASAGAAAVADVWRARAIVAFLTGDRVACRDAARVAAGRYAFVGNPAGAAELWGWAALGAFLAGTDDAAAMAGRAVATAVDAPPAQRRRAAALSAAVDGRPIPDAARLEAEAGDEDRLWVRALLEAAG